VLKKWYYSHKRFQHFKYSSLLIRTNLIDEILTHLVLHFDVCVFRNQLQVELPTFPLRYGVLFGEYLKNNSIVLINTNFPSRSRTIMTYRFYVTVSVSAGRFNVCQTKCRLMRVHSAYYYYII